MIRSFLLSGLLCLSLGCQFTRNVIVDKNGQWFPWYANRDNPEYQKKWDEEKADWQIKDAERRYDAGLMDRYRYNQIRKRHGLPSVD